MVVVEFEGNADRCSRVVFGCFMPFSYAVGEFIDVVEYAGFGLKVEFFECCSDVLHWLDCYAVEGSGSECVVGYFEIVCECSDVCSAYLVISFYVGLIAGYCGDVVGESVV